MHLLTSWFQSTHPHGVRLSSTISDGFSAPFQSTHPHGVRHDDDNSHILLIPVSIHAPTWGATPENRYPYRTKVVSIHAPTWGATLRACATRWQTTSFNPRTHMGCDRSLHPSLALLFCFNPRTHMGCDKEDSYCLAVFSVSIHAPTWGAT